MAETQKKPSGLGKGLSSIFVDNGVPEELSKCPGKLKLSEIEPRKGQPRKSFDPSSLSDLAASIAEVGVINPIIVRPGSNGFYQIIAGERRWRAAKMAGLSEVPVIVLDSDDRNTAEIAMIENVQRQDLNAVEEAMGYRTLIDEYGLTQEELSRRVGKSRPAISNALRLLDLPDATLANIVSGQLSAGHARTLLGLVSRADIPYAADQIIKRDLSVRDTENLIKTINKVAARDDFSENKDEAEGERSFRVDYTDNFSKRIAEYLGRRVKITEKGNTRKIELFYEDNQDLEELVTQICGHTIEI